MKPIAIVFFLLSLVAGSQAATVASDLANATILQEFRFDDAAGTTIDQAVNDAEPLNQFDIDSDTSAVVTNGSGQLDGTLKANDEYGSNFIDIHDLDASSGRILAVIEMTWDFGDPPDTAENEDISLALMDSPGAGRPNNGDIAQLRIQRNDADNIILLGEGAGASSLPTTVLNGGSLEQAATFVGVLDVNLSTSSYAIHFSTDGGATFATQAIGTLDPTRDVARSLRFGLNNDLSEDNVLIDRIYLATIPEPSTAAGVALFALGGLARRRRR